MQQQVTETRDVWTFRDHHDLGSNVMETHADISGFSVEAVDGSIGKVDDATYDVGQQLPRRRHRPLDLRPEGHDPRRCRARHRRERRSSSSSTGRRTRSRARPSTTSRSPATTRTAAASAPTTGRVAPATATGTTRSRRGSRRLPEAGVPRHRDPASGRLSDGRGAGDGLLAR